LRLSIVLLAGLLGWRTGFAAPAPSPATGPWYVRVGALAVFYHSSATFAIGGQTLAGASATVTNNETLSIDVGREFGERFSLSLLVGAPPKPTIFGTGTVASLHDLGRVRFGPAILTGSYHFRRRRAFRPYAGLAAAYVIIFNDYDESVTELDVHNHWAAGALAGAEYRVNGRCEFFVDLKHLWLFLDADYMLPGDVPATARVTLDPLLVSMGMKFHLR